MEKKLNKWKVIMLINTVVILFFVLFYSYRLYHFWSLQMNSKEDVKLLVDSLLQNISYIDQTTGLIDNNDGTYTYKGDTKYNYIKYSGRMFRILSIDKNKNMKIVLENSDVLFGQDLAESYNDTLIQQWLNDYEISNGGIYYNTLNNQDVYLTKNTICVDKIDDVENITCETTDKTNYVSMLSLNDYKIAGGASSFLNNGESFWLLSRNSVNKLWNVATDGGLNIQEKLNSFYGVRPVVTLKSTTAVYKGNGTEENPYLIENPKAKTEFLMDTNIGDYVTYSGYTWKIIDRSVEKVKLALDGYIKVDDKEVLKSYNSKVNTMENKQGTLTYYLNNDFYNSLENNDLIETSTWYYGKITDYSTYKYTDLYSNSVDLKVGTLKLDDLYANEYGDIFLSSRPYGDDNLIYTINEENKVFVNFVTAELKVRPVINIAGSAILDSGKGTINKPYVLEVLEDEQSSAE